MTHFTAKSLRLQKLYLLFLFVLISSSFFNGCSSQSDAAWKTIQMGFRNETSQIEKAPLKNNLSYLRVNINGLDVLLVKGYIDSGSNGLVDVWYSSDGSVLRIQEGRYVGSFGFDQNWQEVFRNDAPSFNMLLNSAMSSPIKLSSALDQNPKKYFSAQSYIAMPSYKAMRDERISTIVLAPVLPESSATPATIPRSFKNYLANKELIWISETPQPNDIFKKKGDSFAWYGFLKTKGGFVQVIGQQCLSKDFCITWTPWPVQP